MVDEAIASCGRKGSARCWCGMQKGCLVVESRAPSVLRVSDL